MFCKPLYNTAFHSDGLSHDTISMELSILYFKGLPVIISIKMYLCSWGLLLSEQTVPPYSSSGSPLFARVSAK